MVLAACRARSRRRKGWQYQLLASPCCAWHEWREDEGRPGVWGKGQDCLKAGLPTGYGLVRSPAFRQNALIFTPLESASPFGDSRPSAPESRGILHFRRTHLPILALPAQSRTDSPDSTGFLPPGVRSSPFPIWLGNQRVAVSGAHAPTGSMSWGPASSFGAMQYAREHLAVQEDSLASSARARSVATTVPCGHARRHKPRSYWRGLGRDAYIRVEGKDGTHGTDGTDGKPNCPGSHSSHMFHRSHRLFDKPPKGRTPSRLRSRSESCLQAECPYLHAIRAWHRIPFPTPTSPPSPALCGGWGRVFTISRACCPNAG